MAPTENTLSELDQLVAEDLASEIMGTLLRVLAQFMNNPDADACAAAFHAERE